VTRADNAVDVSKLRRVTSQEPFTQHLSDPDCPDTEVILVEQPAPVFVDSTGRRRRVLRRFSYAFGAFCMVYGGLISLSLAGGPVSPNAVLPFPDLITGAGRTVEAAPTPTPRTTVSAPKAVLVNEATARRGARQPTPRATATGGRPAARPTRTSTPPTARVRPSMRSTAQWQATVVSPRPTEAAVTRRPTPSTPSATTTLPVTSPPASPAPPASSAPQPTGPGTTGTTGGNGGGGTGTDDPGPGERR
jgi:hypothetical protein